MCNLGILKSRSDGYYVKEWKNELEMRLRKAMDVEVQMIISDDDLYFQGLQCYVSDILSNLSEQNCFRNLVESVT